MSIKRLIDKQILVYLYNGIPLKNIKKEMNYDTQTQNNYAK